MATPANDRSYEPPTITVAGTAADLTQAQTNVPTFLDATFPAGTPFPQLTWSQA